MAVRLAKCSEIKEGKSLIVKDSEGREIGLIKLDGQIYCFENVCPHMDGPVCEGEIDGGTITCPWHGWKFDIKNGQCKNVDCEELKKIPIKIEDDNIYLA